MSALLEVRGLTVSLPRSGNVVEKVSLNAVSGEVHGIVGESGAGKSVLARTLLGLTQQDPRARVSADTLMFDGRDLRTAGQRAWRSLRGGEIGLVLQDALQSLDPLRTVKAEVGETLAVRRAPRSERRSRILDSLRRAGLDDAESLLGHRSGKLSGGMRQRVLIASAIVGNARLIIADEPTTALDATVAMRVLDLLRVLADDGAAVILITHDLNAVRRIADRVTVLEGGRAVEQGSADQLLDSPDHPTTRELLAAIPTGPKSSPASPGDVALEARGVSRRYGSALAVDDASLSLRAGETLGIVGESGSGKSTLARVLIGSEQPDGGAVTRPNAPVVRLVPQDPLGSFDPRHSVGRILERSRRGAGATGGELLAKVGLDTALLARMPSRLSGGQRQRVAIARALAADPDVLVLDEPVSALDVTTQAGILDLLGDLQRRERLAMIFISHDLAVVRRVADRVAVMQSGRIIETGPTEQVYQAPAHALTRALVRASGHS